jgi:ERCC4-related helicase
MRASGLPIDALIHQTKVEKKSEENLSKINQLINLLQVHSSKYEHRELYAIVFVKTRFTADYLQRILTHRLHEFGISKIIGQNKGMTRAQQEKVIEQFRNDKSREHRVLIATSVAEEGLDLQNCHLVVQFNRPRSITSQVQSSGRARQKESKVIAIVRKGEKEEYKRFLEMEKNLHQALECIERREFPPFPVEATSNPIGTLKELIEICFNKMIDFRDISVTGPAHQPTFEVELVILGKSVTRGKGSSKGEAQHNAAKEALRNNWVLFEFFGWNAPRL